MDMHYLLYRTMFSHLFFHLRCTVTCPKIYGAMPSHTCVAYYSTYISHVTCIVLYNFQPIVIYNVYSTVTSLDMQNVLYWTMFTLFSKLSFTMYSHVSGHAVRIVMDNVLIVQPIVIYIVQSRVLYVL